MLWVAVLKSGVHATLAGVLIAFCIPMRDEEGNSPVKALEHNLHGPVAYVILPMFAFANAGLSIAGHVTCRYIASHYHGSLGRVSNRQTIGDHAFLLDWRWLLVLLNYQKVLIGLNLAGVAFVCGVGFTMSLFIASLAFEHASGR